MHPGLAPTLRLGAQQARNLHLAAQGLLARPRRRARQADVLATIERMRVLQIDTIHVVARSPYLVLFSRLGAYAPHWLDEVLADGAIFECWAHEACFAPIADYALHRLHRAGPRRPLGYEARAAHAPRRTRPRWTRCSRTSARTARSRRPISSAPKGATGGGWWGWKDEKRWLEALFALGELMIARRENFHRVYDLAERVLAQGAARGRVATVPPPSGRGRIRARRGARARHHAGALDQRLFPQRAQAQGRRSASRSSADGRSAARRGRRLGQSRPTCIPTTPTWLAARHGRRPARDAHNLLSPFDPVVWDRERAAAMFGFDYRIECYTPAPKRRYGYFVLPILHRGRLVGRLDAKAHRADGVFEVKAMYLEPAAAPTPALAAALAEALQRCADWHATPQVSIGRCEPRGFRRELLAALNRAQESSEAIS